MKLSELTTDKALDVLCEITPYVSGIVTDEELAEELRHAVDLPKDATRAALLAAGIDKIAKIAPILLKKRRADVLGILGGINGKNADEISKQPAMETIKQIRELFGDRELLDFFKSCGERGQNAPSSR